MEDFKVLIKVEKYILYKKLILRLLSKKLKTHNVQVRAMYNSHKIIFEDYPNITKINYKHIKDFDAIIIDEKEIFIIDRAKLHKKQLRIIRCK